MISLIGYELSKSWCRYKFLILLGIMLCANLGMLLQPSSELQEQAPASGYKNFFHHIETMEEKETYRYIDEYYDYMRVMDLIERIHLCEAAGGTASQHAAESMKKENKEIYQTYEDDWKSKKYLNYTASLEDEYRLAASVKDQADVLRSYPDTLQKIQENKNVLTGISIFSPEQSDGFSYQNIVKTAEDYQGMEHTRLTLVNATGLSGALRNSVTDIILLILVLLIASECIYKEKKNGLFFLTKPTPRGIGKGILAKIWMLGLSSLLLTILFYAENIVTCCMLAGGVSADSTVQSLTQYNLCTLPINIATFILLFILQKSLILWVFAMIISLTALLTKQKYWCPLMGIILYTVGYFCYETITAVSGWNWFKYFNLVGLLKTDDMIGEYFNMNVGGIPVWREWTVLIILLLLAAVEIVSHIFIFRHRQNLSLEKGVINRLFDKIFHHFTPHTSCVRYEGYKIFLMNKAVWIVVLCMLLTVYHVRSTDFYDSPGEVKYKNYMTSLEGELTGEKQEYLMQEQKTYEEAVEQVARIDERVGSGELTEEEAFGMKAGLQSVISFHAAFERVWKNYEFIKNHPKAEFVYDTGYRLLFCQLYPEWMLMFGIALAAIMLIIFSILYLDKRNNAYKLIGCTAMGIRRIDAVKRRIGMLTSAGIVLFMVGMRVYLAVREYGLPDLTAAASSVEIFRGLPGFLSLWMVILFAGMCLIVGIAVFTWLIMKLCSFRNQPSKWGW